MAGKIGRIHSVESFGAVDGPGIRFIVFMQGCPLRCKFCHNPDTWNPKDGTEIDTETLANQIESYRNFIKKGGVTVSGGEPLLQTEFVADLLKRCKEKGFHTAIDTSGGIPLEKALPALEQADMLLLDMKDIDTDGAKELTGMGNENAKAILEYCQEHGKQVWLLHVVVPGYTLDRDKLERLADFAKAYSCIEKVELLPFHKMGEYKWKELREPYSLGDTQEPTKEEMTWVKEIFTSRGLQLN